MVDLYSNLWLSTWHDNYLPSKLLELDHGGGFTTRVRRSAGTGQQHRTSRSGMTGHQHLNWRRLSGRKRQAEKTRGVGGKIVIGIKVR